MEEKIEAAAIEPAYTLRGLEAEDLFPLTTIVSKIGIKEIKDCFATDDVMEAIKNMGAEGENKGIEKIGLSLALEIANVVFANLQHCREEIYLLLSQLSGKSPSEIAHLPLHIFMRMIVDVIRKEEFKDFFEAAAQLLK